MNHLATISNWAASQLRRKHDRLGAVASVSSVNTDGDRESHEDRRLPFTDRLAFVLKSIANAPAWQPMHHLTAVLGCTTFEETGGLWRCMPPHQPPTVYETVVSDQLRHALRRQVTRGGASLPQDGASILDGLAKNGRWKKCVHSLDEAYRLAEVLIDFNAFHAKLPVACRRSIGGTVIMEEWLGLKVGVSTDLEDDLVARAIFGNAWCDLVLNVPLDRRADRWSIISLVETHRPPFLPGRLPINLECQVCSLPDLSIS